MQTFGFMPLGTVTLSYDGPFTFEILPQETGTIEEAPKKPDTLPPECKILEPVNCERAWAELERSCRGGLWKQ